MARPPLVSRSRAADNRSPCDGWTLVHIGWGTVSGAARMPAWLFLALTVAYEVGEYMHEYPHGSRLFGTKRPESAPNAIADVGVACLGYALARQLRGER